MGYQAGKYDKITKHDMRHTILLFFAAILTGCSGGHFLTDKAYRDQVHDDFLERRELAAGRDSALFSVFEQKLSTEQREALEFLYAYMPLSDLADSDGAFFLRQVDGAFRARDEFGWNVPEDLFRHFVLVHRVNNESLDESRDVFFEELKDRVKGLSMTDAALEVNHWCHEKVTYRGSDARTSSALATMKTSWGRCGEESVFTVLALRSVGIPARQCYVPRWAHTDSNHAWVELWVDGAWHYMGACEPEPQLDVAWFDGPVQRAMMTHSTVYGLYEGESPFKIINTLDVYAKTRMAEVTVVDQDGKPVEGAEVQFKVYNGADFYPISRSESDSQGKASVKTGYGDLLVWASVGNKYGYAKSSEDHITLVLTRTSGEEYTEEFTMAAPVEQPFRELPSDVVAKNAVRLAHEDSIRNAYMATFATREYSDGVARETGLDSEQTWKWINGAQGNWREIEAFLHSAKPDAEFMNSLTAKDWREVSEATLASFYPVNPRIGYEVIKPWLKTLRSTKTVDEIIAQVKALTVINSEYYNCRLTPVGVYELGVTDSPSRDIYFVALCRAAGIEARLDPASRKPQYRKDDEWINAPFLEDSNAPKTTLQLTSSPDNLVKPLYGTHYSVARFENGDFRALDFYGRGLPAELPVESGYYRILSSSRANDGSATLSVQYLNIGDETVSQEIKLPEVEGKIFVQGVVDMNSIVGETTLKTLSRGRGAMLVFADPDKEPTKHILQELPSASAELEAWGGAVVFMVPSDKVTEAFDPARFTGLPSQTFWGIDEDRTLLRNVAQTLQIPFTNNFPLVLYLTNNGGILFVSEGYRIGIPEDVLRTIKLEATTK